MLAVVDASQTDRCDSILASVASKLLDDGLRISGALRNVPSERLPAACETTLKVIPDGPDIRITQDLGRGSIACRMDAGAIESVVGLATARFYSEDPDLVILNKFGLSEAEGRGFRSLICLALQNQVPVLTAVGNTHRVAFDHFAEGMATILAPDESEIVAWCQHTVKNRRVTPRTAPKIAQSEW